VLATDRIAPDALAREDADTDRLVIRLQAGEEEPFKALYERYFDRVYAYLRIALRDLEEAEKATQEVFMRVLETLPEYAPSSGPFRAWLFRVARDTGIARLPQAGRTVIEGPAHPSENGEGEGARPTTIERVGDGELVALIERLPHDQQQVILLRYLFGLGGMEGGGALERGPDAVDELHRHALRTLRARLEPVEGELATA